MMDLIIKDVTIVDGSGKPAFCGSIGIEKERIVKLSPYSSHWPDAAQIIDGKGLHAMPGIVDIHRHGDLVPFKEAVLGEEIKQGITTFINGNCGFGIAPSTEKYSRLLSDYAKPIVGEIPSGLLNCTFGELLGRAETGHFPSNMGYLVGGGALRIGVKGFDDSPLTDRELAEICQMLCEALENGAMGLSMGLMYVPENFYLEKELIELCKVAAKKEKPVTVHMRGEGSSLIDSVAEVIRIATASGARMHISHLKAAGKRNWNKSVDEVLKLIEEARKEGIRLTFDVYPYCAGSTALYTLLPPKAMEGGIEKTIERLKDTEFRQRLSQELREEQPWDNLVASTGWNSVVVAGGREKAYEGKSVEQIGKERNVSPEICMMDLLVENQGDVPIVFHSMNRQDMEKILVHPDSLIVSDAIYSEEGKPHPRRYGAFAKAIGEYGQQMGIEKLVQKMTHLPASLMGIEGRGLVREGYFADILLVDLGSCAGQATYENPVQFPSGICGVIINGKLAVDSNLELFGCYGRLIKPQG